MRSMGMRRRAGRPTCTDLIFDLWGLDLFGQVTGAFTSPARVCEEQVVTDWKGSGLGESRLVGAGRRLIWAHPGVSDCVGHLT